MEDLYIFDKPLVVDDLCATCDGSTLPKKIKINQLADLKALEKILQKALSTTKDRAKVDSQVADKVYQILKPLPDEYRRDLRFWQWLSVDRFPEFVWRRWAPSSKFGSSEELRKKPLCERYLGAYSLRGFARHAFARYFIGCESLHKTHANVRDLFSKQQLFQDIFEREIGLAPSVPPAMVAALKSSSDTRTKLVSRLLNHLDHTICLDALSTSEVKRYIQSF